MNNTKEHPIIFSTPMVKAIQEGRKTQTRRVIKPHYRDDESGFQVCTNKATGERWVEKYDENEGSFDSPRHVLPRYNPGDILWVRETWAKSPCEPSCSGRKDENECPFKRVEYDCYRYAAQYTRDNQKDFGPWHPSIHMPREAARIFLRVTDVRVEWVQDIGIDDIQAEGFDLLNLSEHPRFAFASYWDNLNAKRKGCLWEDNPFVFVYSFEKVNINNEI